MSEATVYIFESEYQAMIAEAQRIPESETGGDLYGTFTHGSMPVVWLASGPGPKASGNKVHFQQDPDFTTYWEAKLMEKFAVQYIGSWHSHNFLGIIHPSGGDVSTVHYYAKRHERQTSIDIIVTHDQCGNNTYRTTPRPYFYPDAQYGNWVNTKFQVLQGESPLRQLLRTEEHSLSPGIFWRTAKEEFSYRSITQSCYSEKAEEFSSDHNYTDARQTEIPQQLKSIIEKLNHDGIVAQVAPDGYLLNLMMEIKPHYFLGFVLYSQNLWIKSVTILLVNRKNLAVELDNLLIEKKMLSHQEELTYKIVNNIYKEREKIIQLIEKSL